MNLEELNELYKEALVDFNKASNENERLGTWIYKLEDKIMFLETGNKDLVEAKKGIEKELTKLKYEYDLSRAQSQQPTDNIVKLTAELETRKRDSLNAELEKRQR